MAQPLLLLLLVLLLFLLVHSIRHTPLKSTVVVEEDRGSGDTGHITSIASKSSQILRPQGSKNRYYLYVPQDRICRRPYLRVDYIKFTKELQEPTFDSYFPIFSREFHFLVPIRFTPL